MQTMTKKTCRRPASRLVEIAAEPRLYAAWEKTALKNGAPGIDHVSIEKFSRCRTEEIRKLHEELISNHYQPQPLIVFPREKKDHTFRELTIATVRDRVVARSAASFLVHHFDKTFQPQNYAYRPRKGALKAVAAVQKACRQATYAARIDIVNFFDTINHQLLLEKLQEMNLDEGIIQLLLKVCRNRRFDGVSILPHETGVPQGSPLAPVLSNIYLNELDKQMNEEGYRFARYADDILILADSADEASGAMNFVNQHLRDLKLEPSTGKSRVYSIEDGFVFLGFFFNTNGHVPSKDARSSLNRKLAEGPHIDENDNEYATRRSSIVRGWNNYFLAQDEADVAPVATSVTASTAHDDSVAMTTDDRTVEREERPLLKEQEIREQIGAAEELIMQQRWSQAVHILRRLINDEDFELSGPEQHICFKKLAMVYHEQGLQGAAEQCLKYAGGPHQQNTPDTTDAENAAVFDSRDIENWMKIFGTSEGVVKRQYVDRTGRHGYRPASHSLKKSYIRDHWKGMHTLAVPLYDKENHVHFAVLDLDVSRKTLDQLNDHQLQERRIELLDDARHLLELAHRAGVEGIIEDSGYKGYHVWFFFHARLSAELARLFLYELCRVAGASPEGTHREMFPASAGKQPDRLGAYIKLPLGKHRLSGRWSRFLTPEERMIIRSILDPMGAPGREAVHAIMSLCENYDRHLTDTFLGQGHYKPIGCMRIREILGDFCDRAGCSCHFKQRKGDYAHPLRHIPKSSRVLFAAGIPQHPQTVTDHTGPITGADAG